MKRFLVVLAAAGAVMAAAATPALANDNGCVGSTVSSQTPGVVQDHLQGARASGQALSGPGGRADAVQGFFQTFCPGFPG